MAQHGRIPSRLLRVPELTGNLTKVTDDTDIAVVVFRLPHLPVDGGGEPLGSKTRADLFSAAASILTNPTLPPPKERWWV